MKIFNASDSIKLLTQSWSGARFDDGRPHVSDDILERMKLVTTEEAWAVLQKHGYARQFEGNWFQTHPETILVGRAVTAMMVPHRPDLNDVVESLGKESGEIGGQNSWVIDSLQVNDVMVVDMFGKIHNGTFIGDNLGTSVARRTQAGAVIHGGIRDYDGISKLENVNIFCRGLDPTAIADTTLAGVNIPIRIGPTTILPGDIVLGTPTGVIFIPPHLAEEVVVRSEDIRVRDEFGKLRLSEGKYTPGEIDVGVWEEHIEADYQEWLKARS